MQISYGSKIYSSLVGKYIAGRECANGKWVSIVPETASRLFSFGPSTQARKALCHNKNCNSEVGYVSLMEIKVKISSIGGLAKL